MVKSIALGLARYGITTWLDEAEMAPGDSLIDRISTAIEKARWFCVFLTQNSVDKPWVKFELAQAMEREISTEKTFVVPVVLFDCKIPVFLRHKIYIDLRNWDHYATALEKLAARILGDIRQLPPDFDLDGLDDPDLTEDTLLSFPASQAAIELRLRFEKWRSRRLSTLRNAGGLTLKQVINYCESAPHIMLSPAVNAHGEIYYGTRWRVTDKYNSDDGEYQKALRRYLKFLQRHPGNEYPADVIEYLFSFYEIS